MEIKSKNLDAILDEVGYVGRSQIFCFCLIFFIIFLSGTYSVAYVFTAGDLNYRCQVNDCDNGHSHLANKYNPNWLKSAVPYDEGNELPHQCYKYKLITRNNITRPLCDSANFNTTVKIKCDKFVFENDERTILNEFDLTCNENKWKLALPGTLHSAGVFCNLLIIGYVSDKFGRKWVFIGSPLIAVGFGMLQSISWNYWSFAVFKFLETLLSGGTYSSGIVLAMELVAPSQRAIVGTILFGAASLGKIYLGFTAMMIQHWRIMTIVNFLPSLVALTYIWIIPESIKWLSVKRRHHQIADILRRIVKWNKIQLSDETHHILVNQPELIVHDTTSTTETTKLDKDRYPIADVFKSPALLWRICGLSVCWITNILIFFGLTLISVSIGGNKYTNFMIVNFMEIPACIFVILISNRVGRKVILCTAFILSAITLFIYPFVAHLYWLKVGVFMFGKFSITVSFTTIYIYTSEMVPTNLRQTLISICSAFGRIGSILAPQAPLLELVMKNLTIYVFGFTALTAGLLSLQFPETLNTKLPDTIEEALAIGKKNSKSVDNETEMK